MCYSCEQMEAGAAVMEASMERQAHLDRLRQRMLPHRIWVTSNDTQRINVKDMETSHILNCLNMFNREVKQPKNARSFDNDFIKAWRKIFNQELTERGKMT